MAKENVSLEFSFKKIDETRNDLLEEIEHNDLMSKNHKKGFKILNYFEHFLVSVAVVSGHVSIYIFVSLVGVHVDTASSAVGLKICAINAGIKKYRLIIKKKEEKAR